MGGAVVLPEADGGLFVGVHAAAGHVGHVPSPQAVGLPCSCGGRGHLEAIASGPALVREHGRLTSRVVADLPELAALAAAGDPTAAEVLVRGGTAVGSAIGGLVNVLDPASVVVGGGVVGVGDVWWRALVAAASDELLPALRGVPLRRSTLGGDAALLGAAVLARAAVGAHEGGA